MSQAGKNAPATRAKEVHEVLEVVDLSESKPSCTRVDLASGTEKRDRSSSAFEEAEATEHVLGG